MNEIAALFHCFKHNISLCPPRAQGVENPLITDNKFPLWRPNQNEHARMRSQSNTYLESLRAKQDSHREGNAHQKGL